MAYVNPNYRTKWAVVKHFQEKKGFVLEREPHEESIPLNGDILVKGPRPPEGPLWEATFTLKKGKVINVQ